MRVMVVAPHPDDEAIGCGGALCLHADRGDRVAVVYLTSGELGASSMAREEVWAVREAEARRGCAILGAVAVTFLRLPDWYLRDHAAAAAVALAPLLAEGRPELIYLPHPEDEHPDHRSALSIASAALAESGIAAPPLRGFEVWTPLSHFDEVEDISCVMTRKIRAVRAHASQLAAFRYDRAVRGLNLYRGVMAGRCCYAEVFQRLDPE